MAAPILAVLTRQSFRIRDGFDAVQNEVVADAVGMDALFRNHDAIDIAATPFVGGISEFAFGYPALVRESLRR